MANDALRVIILVYCRLLIIFSDDYGEALKKRYELENKSDITNFESTDGGDEL